MDPWKAEGCRSTTGENRNTPATAIDGAGPWRTYQSVVLPLSVPSIAATAIFLFVIH